MEYALYALAGLLFIGAIIFEFVLVDRRHEDKEVERERRHRE